MKDGDYAFAKGDLPFMGIVEKCHDEPLPVKFLLKRINGTHVKGLDVQAGVLTICG